MTKPGDKLKAREREGGVRMIERKDGNEREINDLKKRMEMKE